MISKEEVEHIAKLARLELSENETKKMQKDLTEILDYFDLLKKAPKVKNLIRKEGDLRATRKDETIMRDASVSEKMIAASPDKKEDYFKVKNIL